LIRNNKGDWTKVETGINFSCVYNPPARLFVPNVLKKIIEG
jgi:hypothetical protein